MRLPAIKEFVPVNLRPFFKKINEKYQKNCLKEVTSYAECVKSKGLELQQHECQQNFQDMLKCLRA